MFFLGHLLPQVQDKRCFLGSQVSDCTSSLFVQDGVGRLGPEGMVVRDSGRAWHLGSP